MQRRLFNPRKPPFGYSISEQDGKCLDLLKLLFKARVLRNI